MPADGDRDGNKVRASPGRSRSFGSAVKTIVLMDVVGSSAMWSTSDEFVMMQLLKRLDQEVMARLRARAGGSLIKTNGDAFMFCFDDLAEAVLFALEVQTACVPAMAVLMPGLQMRVGIAEGLVYTKLLSVQGHEVRDYFGNTVNIAARLEAHTCLPGEVAVASSVQLQPLYDLLVERHRAALAQVHFVQYKNLACGPHANRALPQVQGELVLASVQPVDTMRGVPEFSCLRLVLAAAAPPRADAHRQMARRRCASMPSAHAATAAHHLDVDARA